MKRETILDVTLLRLHLVNKTEPEDGLFCAADLFAITLDYSNESLENINRLLIELYQKGYRTQDFVSLQSHANFLIMIAIYLCDTISYHTQEKCEWFNYYEATARLPREYTLHQGFFSSIVVLINHQVCLPFLVIEDLLSEPHENSRNCVSYVAERCIIITKTKINNPNELCKDYLTALQQHKIIPGGNFYKAATDHIRFDYSLRSIEEIDRLLFCIREHEKLSAHHYEQFIQQPDKANFLLLIAFYIGSTIAQHSCLPIQWYNFEDYLKQFSQDKKMKYRFDIHHVFSMRNQLYFPLQFLKESLFTEQLESISCLEYVELGIPRQTGFIQRYNYKSKHQYPSHLLTPLQRQTFYDAGYLASYALYMVLDNDHYIPTLLSPSDEGPSNLKRLESSFPEIEGLDLMQNNPEHKPYQIYSEDGYAYLDTGRTDAIRIDIRNYAGQNFKLSLAIPYQSHHVEHRTKIFNVVRYSASSLSEEQIAAGMAEFYDSAFQFISPITHKSLWEQFYEPVPNTVPSKTAAGKDFLLIQQRKFKQALKQTHPASVFKLSSQQSDESQLYRNPFQHIRIQDEIWRLAAKDRHYLQVDVPQWLLGDELYKQVLAMPTLYQRGRIVWGCLVHTHDIMHYPGDEHCEGEILYDPTGRTDPAQLQVLAYQLYRLRGTKSKSPDVMHYIEHLNTEYSRIYDFAYPPTLSHLPMRVSSIWFYRRHLPNGMLALPYFPILLCDDEKYRGQVMVLPAWFWPKDLRDEWLTIANKRLVKHHDVSETLYKTPRHIKASEEYVNNVPHLKLIYQNLDDHLQDHSGIFRPSAAALFSMRHMVMIAISAIIFTTVAMLI